ncbi:hypothetical protein QTA56_06365 [Acinetobacter sp. VNH17]|uniref:Uncharacterized protein n=1 Tax=Acinetobacter thutiue TaxID=2998078 RepID=A0ABT7WMI4_9GAMM|nr:hypothetical protein [Acinetobacter thutiue]MCY6411763.1 hypothetical protein [Acinetobacter thutiue]MDN0013865.1 hypothetical protein [Acinetobacter thutiue]
MTTLHTVSFQKTVLASLIGLCLSQSAFALQELPDENLSEAIGEGIAFLPENFSMRMNGADTANDGRGTYDTGYIRLIPVGPLQGNKRTGSAGNYTYTPNYTYNTTDGEVYDGNGQVIKKADIFLYGLNLSQSNTDWGTYYNASNANMSFGRAIDTWGTANNPWIFKTETKNVQQFSGNGAAGQPVTFFNFEAPLYDSNVAGLTAAEKSAYNLRLSLWGDAFMRDANTAEGKTTANAYDGLSNQLRFNMVWDGFSVNGSNFKMFRTLGGVTNQLGLNKSYNNTLGMAALVRLNSGPTDGVDARGKVTNISSTSKWQSYDASKVVYQADKLSEAQLAELKAGNFSSIGGTNAVVIATGAGTAPSGTVLWNGPVVAGQDGTLAQANPNNPSYNHVIRSYVPLGNSQGNNIIDDATPRSRVVDGKTVYYNYNTFWVDGKYTGIAGAFGDAIGYGKRSICGLAAAAPGTSIAGGNVGPGTQCFNQEGFRVISAVSSNTNTWTLPANARKSVLRINATPIVDKSTPALGGMAPSFDDQDKGLFLYSLNANLVIGSLYQPLIFDAKGGNFSVEVTRVPNDPNVYSKIYTRYGFDANTKEANGSTLTYTGSTCNVYQCGTSTVTGYQGSTATHSSITIGSTEYDATNNLLSAYKGIEAYGISFGSLESNPDYGQNLTSTGQRDYVQTFNTTRTIKDATRSYMMRVDDSNALGVGCGTLGLSKCYNWLSQSSTSKSWNGQADILTSIIVGATTYNLSCSPGKNNTVLGICTPSTNNANTPAFYQYRSSATGTNCSNGSGGATNNCSGNNYDVAYYINPNYSTSSWTNPWAKTNNTVRTQNTNYQILGQQTGCLNNCGVNDYNTNGTLKNSIPTTFPTDLTSARTLSNNMGSAVIDGLLIQHMKLTTTGLN